MKTQFLIIRAIILFSVLNTSINNKGYSQRIYVDKTTKRNVIYLGAYNDENQLRVYDRNRIVYINKNNLKQIEQLSAKQLLDTLSKYKLSFLCEGSEPFWRVNLNKKRVIMYAINKNGIYSKDTIYNIDINSAEDYRCIIMFTSKDRNVYGVIKKTVEPCDETVTEEHNTFECVIYIKGKIYTGCGLVDKENQM